MQLAWYCISYLYALFYFDLALSCKAQHLFYCFVTQGHPFAVAQDCLHHKLSKRRVWTLPETYTMQCFNKLSKKTNISGRFLLSPVSPRWSGNDDGKRAARRRSWDTKAQKQRDGAYSPPLALVPQLQTGTSTWDQEGFDPFCPHFLRRAAVRAGVREMLASKPVFLIDCITSVLTRTQGSTCRFTAVEQLYRHEQGREEKVALLSLTPGGVRCRQWGCAGVMLSRDVLRGSWRTTGRPGSCTYSQAALSSPSALPPVVSPKQFSFCAPQARRGSCFLKQPYRTPSDISVSQVDTQIPRWVSPRVSAEPIYLLVCRGGTHHRKEL